LGFLHDRLSVGVSLMDSLIRSNAHFNSLRALFLPGVCIVYAICYGVLDFAVSAERKLNERRVEQLESLCRKLQEDKQRLVVRCNTGKGSTV
jgi:hypothetical protein